MSSSGSELSELVDGSSVPGVQLPTPLELAAVSLSMQHPLTRTWDSDQARLPRLAAAHQGDLDLATSLDFARMRAERFAFPERTPAEYLNRWQPVSGDLKALLSLRFRNLDRDAPFVDVSGLSRPWTAADLPALQRAALDVFGVFRPKFLRLFSPETGTLPGLRREKRFVAAPVSELAEKRVETPPELALIPTADDRHLQDAAAAYAALDRQHPAHARQAGVLNVEELQEAIDAGLMFDVRVGGRWAGYAGVLPGEKLGLLSYTVQELLLTPTFRGCGYGAHLTTLLARALLTARPEEPRRVLLGTIHADNAGAYPAALRAGRHDVGGWDWLKI